MPRDDERSERLPTHGEERACVSATPRDARLRRLATIYVAADDFRAARWCLWVKATRLYPAQGVYNAQYTRIKHLDGRSNYVEAQGDVCAREQSLDVP